MRIPNPKPNPYRRTAIEEGRSAWYPFYPGFSKEFAEWTLETFRKEAHGILLDPWNGAGTSTSAAAEKGMRAFGVDKNPVMVVAARARLVDPADSASIKPLALELVRQARRSSKCTGAAKDPLDVIVSRETAVTLRSLERITFRILVSEVDTTRSRSFDYVNNFSPIAAFFYVALFRTIRALTQSLEAKNPVWTKIPKNPRRRSAPKRETVFETFLQQVDEMVGSDIFVEATSAPEVSNVSVMVDCATALQHIEDESVDLVITSPPYCTRLDYAVATMRELLLLGYDYDTTFRDLRTALLGTTTVQRHVETPVKGWGSTCLSFLQAVRSHSSFASQTYYFRNHSQYFSGLYRSVQRIAQKMRRGGTALFVAQDSYYKEVHNDLPSVIAEMAAAHRLVAHARTDFALSNPLAASNPRARKYRTTPTAVESVLVLEKN